MRLSAGFFCLFFAMVFFLVLVEGAGAFTVQDVVITPSTDPVAPETAVTATYTIHMDSWMTGTTFESGHTLDMYTELSNPSWYVTMSLRDEEDMEPVVSTVLQKSSMRARIDGWTLSYSSAQIDLAVTLKGTTPEVSGSQSRVIFRVQELDGSAEVVSGTTTTRKYQVAVPTTPPTPTPSPTTEAVTTVPTTETPPPTPTVKQTYSPGPGALAICGTLAALVVAVAWVRRK